MWVIESPRGPVPPLPVRSPPPLLLQEAPLLPQEAPLLPQEPPLSLQGPPPPAQSPRLPVQPLLLLAHPPHPLLQQPLPLAQPSQLLPLLLGLLLLLAQALLFGLGRRGGPSRGTSAAAQEEEEQSDRARHPGAGREMAPAGCGLFGPGVVFGRVAGRGHGPGVMAAPAGSGKPVPAAPRCSRTTPGQTSFDAAANPRCRRGFAAIGALIAPSTTVAVFASGARVVRGPGGRGAKPTKR
jgi:hypothetical protein